MNISEKLYILSPREQFCPPNPSPIMFLGPLLVMNPGLKHTLSDSQHATCCFVMIVPLLPEYGNS